MPHQLFADAEKCERNTSVRGSCAESSTKGFNYDENTYAFAGNGLHARLEFVCLGTGNDNDDHNPRDHGGATDSGTTDHNHSQQRRLLIRQIICSHGARRLIARSFLGIV
jgi:hypothetical protein